MEQNIDSLWKEVKHGGVSEAEDLEGRRQRAQMVASVVEDYTPEGGSILSLGSGHCDFEVMLSKMGYDVVAIDDLNDGQRSADQKERFVKEINSYCVENGVTFHCQNVFEMTPEFLDSSDFDTVIALDVIEHIHQPQAFLDIANEALKSGGYFILLTPNSVDLAKRIRVLLGRPYGPSVKGIHSEGPFRGHIKEYTDKELDELIQLHDFTPIETRFFNQAAQKVRGQADSLPTIIITWIYEVITQIRPTFQDTQITVGEK